MPRAQPRRSSGPFVRRSSLASLQWHVRAAFDPIGSVELRRDCATIDLAGAVERQRADDIDETGMRIGWSLGQAICFEILGTDGRTLARDYHRSQHQSFDR